MCNCVDASIVNALVDKLLYSSKLGPAGSKIMKRPSVTRGNNKDKLDYITFHKEDDVHNLVDFKEKLRFYCSIYNSFTKFFALKFFQSFSQSFLRYQAGRPMYDIIADKLPDFSLHATHQH